MDNLPKRKYSFKAKALATVLATGLAAGGLEIVSRVALSLGFSNRNAKYMERYEAGEPLFLPTPEKGYEYITRPNMVAPSTLAPGERITTDGDGFRVAEKKDRNREGLPKVHFYGDSFTFGVGVGDGQTFPNILGEKLNLDERNFGVSGYDTFQELSRFKENLENEIGGKPDLIVFNYFPLNDTRPHACVPRHPRWEHYGAISWGIDEAKFNFNELAQAKDWSFRFKPRKQVYSGINKEVFRRGDVGFDKSIQSLEEVAEIAKRNNVPIIFTIIPSFGRSFKDEESYGFTYAHKAISEEMAGLGLEYYDLLPNFLGKDSEGLVADKDGHPNARGHKEIADLLIHPIEKKLFR